LYVLNARSPTEIKEEMKLNNHRQQEEVLPCSSLFKPRTYDTEFFYYTEVFNDCTLKNR
jgi:hypothetical protein